MFKKTIISILMIAGMNATASYAADLTIQNNTDNDSTSVINHGLCSTKVLGQDGITKARTTKVIKEFQLRLACMLSPENCKADVYMTNNCSGDIITTITFSTKSGIKSVTPPKHNYVVTHTPFSIKVDKAS